MDGDSGAPGGGGGAGRGRGGGAAPAVVVAEDVVLPGGVLMQIFSPSLTPAAHAAGGPLNTETSFEETYTVSGLLPGGAVFVSPPSQTAACPMSGARVSALNTLALTYTKQTTAACTPASGTYRVTNILKP